MNAELATSLMIHAMAGDPDDAVRTLLLATSALLRKRYGPKDAAQVLRDAAAQIEKPLLHVVE